MFDLFMLLYQHRKLDCILQLAFDKGKPCLTRLEGSHSGVHSFHSCIYDFCSPNLLSCLIDGKLTCMPKISFQINLWLLAATVGFVYTFTSILGHSYFSVSVKCLIAANRCQDQGNSYKRKNFCCGGCFSAVFVVLFKHGLKHECKLW